MSILLNFLFITFKRTKSIILVSNFEWMGKRRKMSVWGGRKEECLLKCYLRKYIYRVGNTKKKKYVRKCLWQTWSENLRWATFLPPRLLLICGLSWRSVLFFRISNCVYSLQWKERHKCKRRLENFVCKFWDRIVMTQKCFPFFLVNYLFSSALMSSGFISERLKSPISGSPRMHVPPPPTPLPATPWWEASWDPLKASTGKRHDSSWVKERTCKLFWCKHQQTSTVKSSERKIERQRQAFCKEPKGITLYNIIKRKKNFTGAALLFSAHKLILCLPYQCLLINWEVNDEENWE